jgi:hypothetical protein
MLATARRFVGNLGIKLDQQSFLSNRAECPV